MYGRHKQYDGAELNPKNLFRLLLQLFWHVRPGTSASHALVTGVAEEAHAVATATCDDKAEAH